VLGDTAASLASLAPGVTVC